MMKSLIVAGLMLLQSGSQPAMHTYVRPSSGPPLPVSYFPHNGEGNSPSPYTYPLSGTGAIAGDYAFLYVTMDGQSSTTTPSGWTIVSEIDTGPYTLTCGGLSYSYGIRQFLMYKQLTSGDLTTGPTFTYTSNIHCGQSIDIAGADIRGAFTLIETASATWATPGATTSPTLSTSSSPQIGDLALWFGGGYANQGFVANRGATIFPPSTEVSPSPPQQPIAIDSEQLLSSGVQSVIFTAQFTGPPTGVGPPPSYPFYLAEVILR